MRHALFLFLILITGCAATTPKQQPESATTSQNAEEPSESKRIYYFQHRVISKWVFESEGWFYADLLHGNLDDLVRAAEEIISTDYANGIAVIPLEKHSAILIVFPHPDTPPNCYYALIIRDGDNDFRYITYERTMDITKSRIYGVVGSWDREGNHSNFGGRTYKTSEEFVADALNEN
jgi:hypothetical protein